MDNQKAIEVLKNAKYLMQREDYEANKTAIEALEKQIPVKPEYDCALKVYNCMDCGYKLESFIDEYGVKSACSPYCPSCGQRIKFIEEN